MKQPDQSKYEPPHKRQRIQEIPQQIRNKDEQKVFSEGPKLNFDQEITAFSFLYDEKLIALALKGYEFIIRELDYRQVISSIVWKESIIWSIYEHLNSQNCAIRLYLLYIIHSTGVALVQHDGKYRKLKIIQKLYFN